MSSQDVSYSLTPTKAPASVPMRWTIRYLDETGRERSTCGWRHRLLSAGDGPRPAEAP